MAGPKAIAYAEPRIFVCPPFAATTTYFGSLDDLALSTGHPRGKSGNFSSGGNFLVRHLRQDPGVAQPFQYTVAGTQYQAYSGGSSLISCPYPSSMLTGLSSTSKTAEINTAKPYYATGWSRTVPGRPEAHLGQFLVELRDLPKVPLGGLMNTLRGVHFSVWPKYIRSHLFNFKQLGHEYLNIEFGWRPFVKDLQDVYRLMKNIDKRMAQIVRDNGRNVRRKTVLKDTTSTVIDNQGSGNQALLTCWGRPPATLSPGWTDYRRTTTTKERVWYAAAYRYYIPDTSSWQWNARARLALFGSLPTPGLLWDVLPWSWLVDWFSNVGDVIHNADTNAVDNLVALYSFVMRETNVETRVHVDSGHGSVDTRDSHGNVINQWDSRQFHVDAFTSTNIKRRVSGTPYGLDVQATSLTGRQLGILAAIGVTRW